MKQIFALLLLGTLWNTQMQAQILPPEFLCVRGDSLFWELPSNNCGPFVSCDIYGSQNASGPFILLASITDYTQNNFFHPNPSGEVWYFYLLSNYNCPGQTAIPSDTLDNRPPEISPIRNVTVENGQVVVNWQPSPSPEVFAYLIYRETAIGVIPVDTVFSGTTYTDLNAEPQAKSEAYFVNALDRCGNTSIFDLKHRTVFLEAVVNPCRQSLTLSWNLYQNWQNGVGSQQLLVGVNGGPLVPDATLESSDTTFEFREVKDGDTYCFVLQATEAGTGITSKSNEVCLFADIIRPMRDLYINNVTVLADQQVKVTWVWNTEADIHEVRVLRSDGVQDYEVIETQVPQLPLPAGNSFADASAIPGEGPVFYKIQTIDDCDSTAFSTYGATIYLQVSSASQGMSQLSWTPFTLENAQVTSYKVFKSINSDITLLGTVGSTETDFAHEFDPENLDDARACYFVEATATFTTPDGIAGSVESRSNTACAQRDARIFVPNAFAPDGYNQEFRPLISLADIAAFEMHIFDRYGQRVFASTNAGEGWNGKKDGRGLPQGVYIYAIRITQTSGAVVHKRGTVLLLR